MLGAKGTINVPMLRVSDAEYKQIGSVAAGAARLLHSQEVPAKEKVRVMATVILLACREAGLDNKDQLYWLVYKFIVEYATVAAAKIPYLPEVVSRRFIKAWAEKYARLVVDSAYIADQAKQ